MKKSGKLLHSRFWWLWLILIFVVAIYAVSLVHYRLDLTKEKRFSLSSSTKRLLRDLDDQVEIEVFLTGDLSAGFKKLGISTDELLSEFREYSKNSLQYRFVKPGQDLPDSLRYQ